MEDKGNINELATVLEQWGKNLTRPCILIDGIVKTVDETKFTCSIEVNLATFNDVPLKVITNTQSSFIEIPKVNTDCLLRFKDNNINCPQLISVHECEKILIKVGASTLDITDGLFEFNGGANDGLVLINSLVGKINRLENAFNHHMHPTAAIGSPSLPLVFPPNIDIIPISPLTSKSNLENTKITQ